MVRHSSEFMNMLSNNNTKQEKIALVTGGTGYVGGAIAQELVACGYHVVILAREVSPTLVSAQKVAMGTPVRLDVRACDLERGGEIEATIDAIERTLGPISVGVHCAQSKILRRGISELTPEDFRSQFLVGPFGGFDFLRSLGLRMKERKFGVLIGVTTEALEDENIQGRFGGYIASKYALKGLLLELRNDLKQSGVRVYNLAPGFMAGGLNGDLPERLVEFIQKKTKGGILSPESVAKTIHMLIEEGGKFPHGVFTIVPRNEME